MPASAKLFYVATSFIFGLGYNGYKIFINRLNFVDIIILLGLASLTMISYKGLINKCKREDIVVTPDKKK